MRRSFYISSIVAVALFSGCGGSSSADKTAPSLSSSKYIYNGVLEDTNIEVTLISDDAKAQFLETRPEATISGNKMTFVAPPFVEGSSNKYVVPVTAKDEAGNESAPREFIFNVIENDTRTYAADASIVAEVGDKTFTSSGSGSFLVGPTGLLWVDEISPLLSYSDAVEHCTNRGSGFRMPSRTELLNTINYDLDGANDVSLLDEDFAISRAGTGENKVETSWAAKEGNVYFQVNNFSGVDVRANASDEHRVRCVKGAAAGAHDIVPTTGNPNTITDNTTGLEWTKVIISGIGKTYATQDNAESFCPNGFRLPSINELRSIFDYSSSNQVSTLIAPDGSSLPADTYNIWSSTKFTNKTGTDAYFTILNNQNTSIRADEDNQTAYVTCVK